MSDPIEATSKNTETPVEIKPDVLKKKKRSSSAVFISIICIVIVIACLIPVFLGSNVTEKVFGSDSAAETESAQTVGKADSSGAVKDSVNNSLSEDPLAVSAGAVTDINAKGPKGDGKNSVSDDGELLPKVSEGIEAETVKATTKNSVTLEGETLDAIEKKEADSYKSDRPRQQLGGTVAKSEKAESAKADAAKDNTVTVLSRQDNILYKDKIEAEDAALQKRELEVKLAREHALKLEEEQKALAAKAKEDEQKKTADVKSSETVKKTVRKTKRAPLNVTPIPGAQSELTEKNSRHYTVQVLAGGKKAPLLEVADYIDGRYWIYTTKRGQTTWYVLITGDFLSTAEAVAYIRKLPANLKKAGPFVKSFNKVQTEMRNN